MTSAELNIRPATPADRPAVERLWLLFRHDLSEFGGQLPNPDGTFRSERLEAAFSGDVGWAPYLFGLGERPVGFAFVRGLGGPTRVLNSFFVVRGVRRGGVGLRAVREVVARHPGEWEVAFQDANAGAVRFWRRVAVELAGDGWKEERRPVPDRPDLAPDVWVSFRYPSP
ncbi:acetyltransferase [Streptomyces sp. MMG1533]|uniref:GNAT family N-acetyltransferase n=1 Tax=Streptomyces sp. MMG1533 TaxID=1415546 RepID=UPI0006AEE763|nr:GNAT family N-acetyltransferase [Streptomyces sp. MMG1533]KOU70930.1 acetyltransferase [Streptomyces sp. MMG1533]